MARFAYDEPPAYLMLDHLWHALMSSARLWRTLIPLGLALAPQAFAQNLSGVTSPQVDAQERSFSYRTSYVPGTDGRLDVLG
ncbi:hypothetical protein [Parvularcula sp. LCG005]|uniref:hypothetical protein n=1 Tax=Parvularcula sp. LCG005 TaxID=3078805 RepID=UPI00294390FF|nr:hypothetical protein [Parvularcula sp. LCG005]WOI53854.1 hypothetical protein RUI03_02360 [Parvularcula sp. LCG005]